MGAPGVFRPLMDGSGDGLPSRWGSALRRTVRVLRTAPERASRTVRTAYHRLAAAARPAADVIKPVADAIARIAGVIAPVATGVLRRVVRWSGLERDSRPMRVLTGAMAGTALIAVVIALVAGPWIPPPGARADLPISVVTALLVITAAQLARLRLQYGSGHTLITWGEAGLLIALYLVPLALLPVITFVGALAACVLFAWWDGTWSPARVVRASTNICIAASAAGLTAWSLTPPYWAGFSARLLLTLFLSAVVYFLFVTHVAALTAALRTGARYRPILASVISGKLIMSIGNICVGLVVVAVLGVDLLWLLLLPPVLWLLQQGYAYQLSGRDARRIWEDFEQAARALNQLHEPAVADAAIRGAVSLFAADQVEILVTQPGGADHRYQGGAARPAPFTAVRRRREHRVSRPLLVGGTRLGELRLRVPGRTAESRLREQLSLSAYADALAAALHDAAAHRQLHAMAVRSSHEAAHDPLTGLLNRTGFQHRSGQALRDRAPGDPVALLLLDINDFREVNDTLGYADGDRLLRTVAARLRAEARPDELLGRLGGDEFAILLTGDPVRWSGNAGPDRLDGAAATTGAAGGTVASAGGPAGSGSGPAGSASGPVVPAGGPTGLAGGRTADGWADPVDGPTAAAVRRARRLAAVVSRPADVSGVHLAVEASVGVAATTAGDIDTTELLRRADIALYHAKQDGSGVAGYDTAADARSTDRLALLAELRDALRTSDQIVFQAQPAIDLGTGAASALEILPRWRHPRRGLLGPQEFLDVVEGSELVAPFTRYIVEQALALASRLSEQGIDLPVSVNISPRGLLGQQLPDQVSQLLADSGVPADRLTLEITETVVAPERAATTAALAGLRAQGVRLAVADFGSGYSSLTFLTRVPVDEVKIDRAFVARMLVSAEAAAIVRTTIDLARDLRLRVVADGVDTAEQAAVLARMGATAAQGDHFFPPVPVDQVAAALRERERAAGTPQGGATRAGGASPAAGAIPVQRRAGAPASP